MAIASQQYNVGGILLARPFKVRRLGHFGFNALKIAEGLNFYNALLGFKISDELDFAKVPGMPEQVKTLGDARGFHAPRHRPSLVCAVQQRGHGPPA